METASLKAYLVKSNGLVDPFKQATCGCCAGPDGHYSLNYDHCVCHMHQDAPNGNPARVCTHHKARK